MGNRVAKDALYDGFADVAKALANGHRAEIVDVLAQGERCVEDVAHLVAQSVANTSFHLRTLANAGLVLTRREGTRIHYRLASDEVLTLWTSLRAVAAAHRAGIDDLVAAYVGERSSLDEIGPGELAERLAAGDVVLIDVRPVPEYEAGHIAGAVSVPLASLDEWLGSMPQDVEVAAYCRGPYCVYADEAVRLLHGRGRRARRLTEGYPEWRLAGLPVEVGA